MSEPLMNCPFCGGEATLLRGGEVVACHNESCAAEICCQPASYWNRRAPTPIELAAFELLDAMDKKPNGLAYHELVNAKKDELERLRKEMGK